MLSSHSLCEHRERRVITFTPQTVFMIHKIHLTLNFIHQRANEKEREKGSLSSFTLLFSFSCRGSFLPDIIFDSCSESSFVVSSSSLFSSCFSSCPHPVSLFLLHISWPLPPLPFLVHSFLFSFTFLPLLVLRVILRERMRGSQEDEEDDRCSLGVIGRFCPYLGSISSCLSSLSSRDQNIPPLHLPSLSVQIHNGLGIELSGVRPTSYRLRERMTEEETEEEKMREESDRE